jgi:hypothetical protein
LAQEVHWYVAMSPFPLSDRSSPTSRVVWPQTSQAGTTIEPGMMICVCINKASHEQRARRKAKKRFFTIISNT